MDEHAIPCDVCGTNAVVNDVQVVSDPDRPYRITGINYAITCPNCGDRKQSSVSPRSADDNPEPPH